MGQRSQIYIHFHVGDDEGMTARYFQWNYGQHMISRARSVIEFLEKCRKKPFRFRGVESMTILSRFCDIDFDMRDMDISVDILEYCKSSGNFDAESVFGQPNNDGQLLIDVTDDGIRYCFIDYYTEPTPMNAEQYMKWNTECESYPDWHKPDEYTDRETIAYTERNIAFIDSVAVLMTEQEVREFLDRDYNLLLGGQKSVQKTSEEYEVPRF